MRLGRSLSSRSLLPSGDFGFAGRGDLVDRSLAAKVENLTPAIFGMFDSPMRTPVLTQVFFGTLITF